MQGRQEQGCGNEIGSGACDGSVATVSDYSAFSSRFCHRVKEYTA